MDAWQADRRRTFADEAFAVAIRAYASTPVWECALHAAIAQLFEFLAAHPDQTTACVVDEGDVRLSLEHRDELIERFTELLEPGFERAASPIPPVVGEAIGGGIYEVVRSHALARRLDALPAAIPDATVVALSPFIGTTDAAELAELAEDGRTRQRR